MIVADQHNMGRKYFNKIPEMTICIRDKAISVV